MSSECGAAFYSCVCSLPEDGHKEHVCECEGSWDDDGTIYEMPSIAQEESFLPTGMRLPPNLGERWTK